MLKCVVLKFVVVMTASFLLTTASSAVSPLSKLGPASQLQDSPSADAPRHDTALQVGLMEQIREFYNTENHEALFQSKIVREDISSSTANQLSLAYHFRTGSPFGTYNVPQNIDEALYWYERAAETGNAIAHFNIACLTYKSRQTLKYIPEPYRSAKAAQAMQSAAEQGLLFAQLDLSSYYRHGIGLDASFEWSDYWLNEAQNTPAKGYTQSIRAPKPADPLALQASPPSGKWEYLYLGRDDAADWLSVSDAINLSEPITATRRNLILTAYLESGYCSPIDSRAAKLLKLR